MFSPDTTSPFSTGTLATYKCDPGYVLEGEAVRVCEDEGTVDWSGNPAVCTGKHSSIRCVETLCTH